MPFPQQGSGNCFKLGQAGSGGGAGVAGEPAYSLFPRVGAPEAKVTAGSTSGLALGCS